MVPSPTEPEEVWVDGMSMSVSRSENPCYVGQFGFGLSLAGIVANHHLAKHMESYIYGISGVVFQRDMKRKNSKAGRRI